MESQIFKNSLIFSLTMLITAIIIGPLGSPITMLLMFVFVLLMLVLLLITFFLVYFTLDSTHQIKDNIIIIQYNNKQFLSGIKISLLINSIILFVGVIFLNSSFVLLSILGLIQFLYFIPLIIRYIIRHELNVMQGVIIGILITLIINVIALSIMFYNVPIS